MTYMYSHCEDIQEVVEIEIHLSILAHRLTDNTEHAGSSLSSVYEMETPLIF